jgi:predicted RNA-binding protein with TRAM domain
MQNDEIKKKIEVNTREDKIEQILSYKISEDKTLNINDEYIVYPEKIGARGEALVFFNTYIIIIKGIRGEKILNKNITIKIKRLLPRYGFAEFVDYYKK